MPRKCKPTAVPGDLIPDYIRHSRLLQKKKITKRTLATFTEQMLLLFTPEEHRLFHEAIVYGLANKDINTMILHAKMHGLVPGGNGVTITNQMIAANAVAGAGSPVVGYDALIRQLGEARAATNGTVITLPAPPVRED